LYKAYDESQVSTCDWSNAKGATNKHIKNIQSSKSVRLVRCPSSVGIVPFNWKFWSVVQKCMMNHK